LGPVIPSIIRPKPRVKTIQEKEDDLSKQLLVDVAKVAMDKLDGKEHP
jgi:hypothetical protein